MKANWKKKYSKTVYLFLLLSFVLTFSAFRFSRVDSASRLDLALVLQKIVQQAIPDLSIPAVEFSDLSAEKMTSIAAVTGFRIMSGFPNGEFRPKQVLRNHELLHYLHRTWQILRINAPSAKITRQLAQLVGMGRNRFYANLRSSYSIFSDQAKSSELAEYHVLGRICQLLELKKSGEELKITLEDAILHKPINEAYLSINSEAYAVDANGQIVVNNIKDRSLEILASAPGYYPLLLKRDKMQKKHLRLRLRPVRSKIVVRAKKKRDGQPLKRFMVRFDNGNEYSTDSGEIVLKSVLPGYYQIQVFAEGYRTTSKNVCVNRGEIELEASL